MKFQYKIVGLFSRGSLLSEGFLRMRFGELFFLGGGAYYRNFTVSCFPIYLSFISNEIAQLTDKAPILSGEAAKMNSKELSLYPCFGT